VRIFYKRKASMNFLSLIFGGGLTGFLSSGKWFIVGAAAIGFILLYRSDVRAPLKVALEQQQEVNKAIGSRLQAIEIETRKVPRQCAAQGALVATTHDKVKQLLADMKRGVTSLGPVRAPSEPDKSWNPFTVN
jgi:hypothetical protein